MSVYDETSSDYSGSDYSSSDYSGYDSDEYNSSGSNHSSNYGGLTHRINHITQRIINNHAEVYNTTVLENPTITKFNFNDYVDTSIKMHPEITEVDISICFGVSTTIKFRMVCKYFNYGNADKFLKYIMVDGAKNTKPVFNLFADKLLSCFDPNSSYYCDMKLPAVDVFRCEINSGVCYD